jgi:hypothetical protein
MLSDIKNDIDSARDMTLTQKDDLLSEIQIKINELLEHKQEHMVKV